MIKELPNGNINFEGIEVAVIQEPIKNGAAGRLTLSTPILNRDPEEMIRFFEDPLSILELEIVFRAVIISKRVWTAYNYTDEDGKVFEDGAPVLFADYECRSMEVFCQSFKTNTVRSVHIVDSNDCIEMGLHQGKYTADVFMSCTSDQIPSFTNSSFQTNISMIFLDNVGDLPSFIIRQVIPFIENAISASVIPKEYNIVFEHHVMAIGKVGEAVTIMTSPIGFKVYDKIYSISECAPEVIVYNPEIWEDPSAAEIFRTLVRTTFANGDHFYYPIYDQGSCEKFLMRRVANTTKKSAYGDRMIYHIPECVAIRFIRAQYLKMQVTPSIGVFDYKFTKKFNVHYGHSVLELEYYERDSQYEDLAKDLALPKVIVKVDRDIYDNFFDNLPHGIDHDLDAGWKWLGDEIHRRDIQYAHRYELLVSNIREMIIGYYW